MKNLSYTQEYYLCAVNAKGRLSLSKGTEIDCAFFAGAIMELLEHGFVKTKENECIVCDKPLDDDFAYLRPLYDFIATQKKPRGLKDLGTDWMICFKLRNKTWDELREAIGTSLAVHGDVEELTNQGLLRNKTRFAPKAGTVTPIVERIRAELLEDGTVTQETVCLTALLDNSRLIGDYFSKFESDALKKRLEELKDNEAFATARDVVERITFVLTAVTASIAASAATR
ncbi:MAG: GPP34 family phosphoprotein [Defluviitaleaceae bacterium]|nr:GPP34 family phosphoprotein [Defluviitaleaceae bacterium]